MTRRRKQRYAFLGVRLGCMVAGLSLSAGLWFSASANAEDEARGEVAPAGGEQMQVVEPSFDVEALKKLSRPRTAYARTFGALSLGRGLRFNNPYRLETQLGDTAESLSLTATYLDFAINLAFGSPDGLQHGAAMHYASSIEGVSQQVITPSYVAVFRGPHAWMGYGRLGIPIVLTPDFNAGGELALGAAYFLTAGLGITSELVFDLFYGAASPAAETTTYPILSLQVGVMLDYELLP